MTNEPVAYTERACHDEAAIGRFLAEARTGVIAMVDGEGDPYAVPVNFAYLDGDLYFHGMGSGKKVALLERGARVCFTVFRDEGTVADSSPCHLDTAYFSVVVFGEAERVADPALQVRALQAILDKYAPDAFPGAMTPRLVERYRSGMDGNEVSVHRISPSRVTAKHNPSAEQQLPG